MKVYLDSIGCRLNQSEIETMARQFRQAGHEIVAAADRADLAVVNTCAVTHGAAADSRGRIRHIARGGAERIVATGCWATLQPRQAAALPGVVRVVTNNRKEQLVARALDLPVDRPLFDLEPIARRPLPGLHYRTRAFIKVQDGCDNRCAFCVTTLARGAARSHPLADVLTDVRSARDGGAKEIVLTGVHLGSWGHDLGFRLHDLVSALLRQTDVPRLRLSSLEPWDLDDAFFSLWQDPRLMPHLHLPLQSGCAATLKRMQRNTTPDSFRALVVAARRRIPDVAITTDLIAGFPGETEAEFEGSLEFVRQIEFAEGHVFSYSPRPGTGAARMPDQVPSAVRKQRSRAMRLALDQSAAAYRRAFVGRSLSVLWEASPELGERGWRMQGLTGNYLRVSAVCASARGNEVDRVRLEQVCGEVLRGVIRNSG